MQIKSTQDLVTGLLFVVIGIGAYLIAIDYPIGTAQRPGTGVLPKALSWLLAGTGVVLIVKSAIVSGPQLGRWALRPALMITLATVAFALLIDRLGIVLTMAVSMTLAALGTPETRWPEYLLFAVFMIILGVALFIYGLGMPIPVFPRVLAWS
jgi:putative tricarboxylic transport membrane protein